MYAVSNLYYGWKILADVVLAATSIYTSANTRYLINQREEIEIVLGGVERCEGTATSSNTWGVAPLNIVREWVTNYYASNVTAGVTSWWAVGITNLYTNTIGHRSDYMLMYSSDSKLRLAAPYYADTSSINAAAGYYSNAAPLTISNLFKNAAIGNGTSLFTRVPGYTNDPGTTNAVWYPATYGDWPGRAYVTDFQERYKALFQMRYTLPAVTRRWMEEWRGVGYGVSAADAYAMAVASNAYQTSGYFSVPFVQACQVTFFSNHVFETGSNYDTIIFSIQLRVTLTNNQYVSGTNIVVVSSNNFQMFTTNFYTNTLIVTGTNMEPDCSGTYTLTSEGYDGKPSWYLSPYSVQYESPASRYILRSDSGSHRWDNEVPFNVIGTYTPSLGVTGHPNVAAGQITTNIVDGPTPIDYSGTYTYLSNGIWAGSAGYIYPADGDYIIYTNLTLNTNDAYLFKTGDPVGEYAASNFYSLTTAAYAYVYSDGPLDCSGDYNWWMSTYDWQSWWPDWTEYPWTYSGWYDWYDGSAWYITQNTNTLSPAWKKTGSDPEGIYTVVGTGLYGEAHANLRTNWADVWTTEWSSNIWSGAPDPASTTIFYQCWLKKTVCTNTAWASTNIQHRVAAFLAYLIKAADIVSLAFGSGNISCGANTWFDDEGLGLAENNWNNIGSTVFSYQTNNSAAFGGDVTTPPDNVWTSPAINESVVSGFQIQEPEKAVMDWKFLYATNKYW